MKKLAAVVVCFVVIAPGALAVGHSAQRSLKLSRDNTRVHRPSVSLGMRANFGSAVLGVAARSSNRLAPSLSNTRAWTVISRHGEYAQDETECNTRKAVKFAKGTLEITTWRQDIRCGDFNLDGSVRHTPSVWPYATGDVQWKSFSFTYGTISYRAKFPARDTVTWPAVWLLGRNCQATNPMTADVGYSACPSLNTPGYTEIDLTECDTENWCQLAIAQPTSFPVCGYPVDTRWHTFTFTWAPTAVSISVDGKPTGCRFTRSAGYDIPSTPMFLIIQTQTGGLGGTPQNLPAHLYVSNLRVTPR